MVAELEAVGRFNYEVESGWSDNAAEAERRTTKWLNDDYNSQWEGRDAILFFVDVENTFEHTDYEGRSANVGYAFVGYGYFLEAQAAYHVNGYDFFSIASDKNKVWLPATDTTSGAGTFYLEDPDDTDDAAVAAGVRAANAETPTVSLSSLKTTITTETNKIDTTIPGYRECLVVKKWDERRDRPAGFQRDNTVDVDSGLPADTTVYGVSFGRTETYFHYHLYGTDVDLFEATGSDTDTNPQNGYERATKTIRPLPQGEYAIEEALQLQEMVPCGYIENARTCWTINVTSPEGTLHELFFDPVTLGITVFADITNGVLKPTSFTDANSESANLRSISYESATVKVEVTPDDALDDHIVDIIELDGTVSLSLDVADATVDSVNDTLSWSVSSQPWHDGDKLMVRIREAR